MASIESHAENLHLLCSACNRNGSIPMKSPKLARNWRSIILKGSLSFWGNIALVAASAVAGGFASDGTFYWLMALANGAVAALRLAYQKELSDGDD